MRRNDKPGGLGLDSALMSSAAMSERDPTVGYAVMTDRGWPVFVTRDLEAAKAELVRMTVDDMDGAGLSYLRIVKTRFG